MTRRTILLAAAAPQGPWALRIEAAGPLRFRAALRNISKTDQPCLLDSRLQPIMLELTGAGGKAVELFDARLQAKFDSTIYRDSFQAMKPGAESGLRDGVFVVEHGAYTMRFGSFSATGLVAGLYKIRAIWVSAADHYYDAETKRGGILKGVWKGRVESNTIEITLP